MPKTRALELFASTLIPLVPATAIVFLRLYARRIKRLTLWWDDWLAFLSLASCVVYDVYTLQSLRYGMAKRLADIPSPIEEVIYNFFVVQVVEEHTYTIAIGAAQLSLLALYWRLFKDISDLKWGVLFLVACTSIWIIVRFFITIFQCFPPAFLWDKSIEGGICTIDSGQFFIGTVSAHLVIDLALIFLPASQICQLSLPFAQKVAIGGMFTFGFVICIASVMMIISATTYDKNSPEIMWDSVTAASWSAAEIHLSVMTCCLPLMRPPMRIFGGWWSQNFASRKSTTSSSSDIKFDSIRRSIHMRRMKGESSDDLHDTIIEDTRIYGQGEGSDITITGKSASLDETINTGPPGKDGAITVRYEVNLSFSDTDKISRIV